MYSIEGTTIRLTRGDTFRAQIDIQYEDGDSYSPVEGDSVRFAMKKKIKDVEPLLVKDIPIDTLILELEEEDTKNLDFGNYVYDLELRKANGDVATFVTKSTLILEEEVH